MFEGVVDVATGVGKTYILAAAIEYFAELGCAQLRGHRPRSDDPREDGRNFTPGHPKSLFARDGGQAGRHHLGELRRRRQRAVMDDDEKVKLFIFTVQSLMKPTTKQGRKTHEFREGLGERASTSTCRSSTT